MATLMAKQKKTKAESSPKPRGPVLFIRMPEELEAALRSFIEAQPVPPDRTAVGLRALENFLREQGHYPPRK